MHVTTAAAERDWSEWGRMYTPIRNTLSIKRAKMATIHSQLGGMVDGNEGELYELEWIGEGGVGGGRERVKPVAGGFSTPGQHIGAAHRGGRVQVDSEQTQRTVCVWPVRPAIGCPH